MRRTAADKTGIFTTMPIGRALSIMALPTIASQLITLIYNITDTWFIGRTNDPFMVSAASMVSTVFLMIITLSNIYGMGGGNEVVSLLGKNDREEARRVASRSLFMAAAASLVFSLLLLVFMDPLLRFLGASDNNIVYARQYLLVVVVLGTLPTVLSGTMSFMLRNVGQSGPSAFGLMFAGILNMILDPIFMFVLLPHGYEVLGAAIATFLSNIASLVYYIVIYRRIDGQTVLELPRRREKIRKESMRSIYSVGLPAGLAILFFDLTNMMLNRMCSFHGEAALAAMGIVLRVERFPLNVGIGICLGMTPLVAFNHAAGDRQRRDAFFRRARTAGLIVSLVSVVLYRIFAADLIRAFIHDPETVRYGTQILQARCFATPVMFLSFHMVHFMQAVKKGGVSFWLAFIRQLCLNIPLLLLLHSLYGMTGLVWTQAVADLINVLISYVIYYFVRRRLDAGIPGSAVHLT